MSWEGDSWRRRPSPLFRVVNPELYAKPNFPVAILGTGVFVLVVSSLLWQKYSYEKQQLALRNPPEPVERILKDD